MSVTVRYFAGAKAAAGRAEQTLTASNLAELKNQLIDEHGDGLEKVLAISSFLIDGKQATAGHTLLSDGTTVEVLPPFAGG
ncbi:MoaD/ThiS family protein [Haloglycomyces albus]|uniref:MoaD/ThiS family protein n=1 Tax=Haloglycomyces albus TaxID=526067 RepID=UPI00046D6BFA|nr:MoaD/ThiS family protein [Haloglycomyces albus]